jgi:uncharacterized protein (TIGR03435 family)
MLQASFILLTLCAAFGQTFEVASIKPTAASREGGEGNLIRKLNVEATHGSLIMRNISLSSCVQWAYDVKDYQIFGPAWMNDERYDVSAKAADVVPDGQLRSMLQSLLAERFKLTLHRNTKDLAMFVLVVAKGGPKMRPSESDGPGSLRGVGLTMNAQKTSMEEFADSLRDPLHSPVVDMTGLRARFDFSFDLIGYIPGVGEGKDGTRAAVDYATILINALPNQIGLKLEPRKGLVEILVIDHAEKVPTEN